MNRDQKSAAIAEIAAHIDESQAVFAVDYKGISVPQVAELRAKLRESDATFKVVKNSLTERAADEVGAETLKELLEGPTALTFVRGDIATAAKAVADYGRATQLLYNFLTSCRGTKQAHIGRGAGGGQFAQIRYV